MLEGLQDAQEEAKNKGERDAQDQRPLRDGDRIDMSSHAREPASCACHRNDKLQPKCNPRIRIATRRAEHKQQQRDPIMEELVPAPARRTACKECQRPSEPSSE